MNLCVVSVALPLLVGAALIVLRPPQWLADLLALGAAAGCAAASWLLLRRAPVVLWLGGVRPRPGGLALGIDFAVDESAAGLALLGALLVLAALVFSMRYFEKPAAMFQALLLVFLAGLSGFALTGDLFDLFVFFELMGTAAFGLCGYRSREPAPLQGALNFAITNTLGAFITLTGIAVLYGHTGALNFAQLSRTLAPDALTALGFGLVLCGFFVKAAIVPFHFWLADAHGAAPTPACVVFSGVMVEAGLYALARLWGAVFAAPLGPHRATLQHLLFGAGAVTCVLGAVMCFAQRHLKRLLAYSTVAHAGAMLCGLSKLDASGWSGTLAYAAGHGCVKGALFLGAGMVLHRLRHVDELKLRGRGRGLWWLAALFVAGALLLAGAPPGGLWRGEEALGPFALFASVLTGGAVLRVAGRVFFGWGPLEPDAPGGGDPDETPETDGPRELPWTMWLPAAALLAFGCVPIATAVAARRMIDPGAQAAWVLDGAQPAALVAHASHASIAHALIGAGLALLLAALTLFRHRLRLRLPGWSPLMAALRAVHTGEVGDQVAWLTLGAALLGGAAWALR